MKRIYSELYNNHSYNEEDYKEGYEEHCKINGLDMDKYSLFDFINESLEWDYEDLESNITFSDFNVECVIVGYVQLWTGKREIMPVKCDTLWEAIQRTVEHSDFQIIKQVNGHIEVSAIHHDGTNRFSIHLLNEKGINTVNGNLNKSCYHKAINGYIF